jgi:hypothetical protein
VALVLALAAAMLVPCARAEPEPALGIALAYDSNVTRAQQQGDIRADTALEALGEDPLLHAPSSSASEAARTTPSVARGRRLRMLSVR